MGGVGLISPLEFLQLKLVISFLDLLVQSAQIFQLLYPSIPFKCASLIRGERPSYVIHTLLKGEPQTKI